MRQENGVNGWTRCPACLGQGKPHRLVVDGRYRLVRCHECRTEYFRPDPTLVAQDDDSVSHYWEDYKFSVYADPRVQAEFEGRYGAMLERARTHTGSLQSVLDVGCGIGNFLQFAESSDLRAYGVDIEPDAVRAARARGLTAEVSGELDEMLPDGSVDSVTMWDVIEHLYEPEPVLAEALAKLRTPGGVLLLETPDASFWVRPLVLAVRSLTRGLLDVTDVFYYWEHKIYFTERGLRALLERAGCTVVDVRRLTSPRQKMSNIFERDAQTPVQGRLLAMVWPLLEGLSARLGLGNKLMVIAVRQDAVTEPAVGATVVRLPAADDRQGGQPPVGQYRNGTE